MRRSRLGAILAIVVLGAVAVFASTASGSRQADVRIGVFLASAANTYWTAELQGARDVAKKYGNVKLTVYDAQFNTQKQVNQLRDALISNKFDAWFIGPNDGGPLTPLIRQAIRKGVKVGCTLVPCGPDIRNAGVQIPGQVAFAGLGFNPNPRRSG
jgi:ABC-type sugar transport system substrate-binding protein